MNGMDDRAVEIAQALIRCRSITPFDAGALDVLADALKAAGFACERLQFTEDGTPAIDNLFARIGDGPPHICFAGHTDVVPPGEEHHWRHNPFAAEIVDGILYGRGAADMKGGIAAFAAAAIDYVQENGKDIQGTISFLITGDEEGPAINGTRKVLDWMESHGEQPDHCIVGEPTNASVIGEAIKIGRRGSLNGHIVVNGVQGHVAYPHLASNPVKGLIKVLGAFYDPPLDYGSAHFSPTNLEVTSIDVGNPTTNIIPARAEARFNIRYNDRHEPETLEGTLRERTAQALAGSDLQYTLSFEPPAHMFLTEPGPLDGMLSEAVHDVTGRTPTLSTDGGTSDARFIKNICPVVEFGLLTTTIHKVDEQVAIADLKQLAAIYRRFLDLYFDTFTVQAGLALESEAPAGGE
ncbi:MAG TPA: succinyl-diaminopimelate desuccinylase [Methyloceanibacter sp.]|nr:succinyl-diaminopimelate desuccinylase [Methyloceanibacter sp.]